ncbi:universal stress protein [Pseudoxanthomonas sp. J35]|uniref:universal stress protein n=1 Tax=Pseudoxanthomonas sp. J35 TaxID=935852 RepID=UPI0004B40A07|nr:universal stress protein [Pseudoxanthomonas sp. J35]
MNVASEGGGQPRSILLASDLDARSDRALDRAVQLAQAWGARLVVANVVEERAIEAHAIVVRDPPSWYRGTDPVHLAEKHLLEAASARGVQVKLRVERGDQVADRLLEVAREEGCDLVVTGVARQEWLGRMILGSTVDQLARRSPLPVLVVRNRAHAPYRRMVVASDWSPSSENAFRTATTLFPEAAISVLHGYDVPMAGLMDTGRDDMLAMARKDALAEGQAFVERCRPPGGASSVSLVVERGDPALLMRLYAEQFPVDLAVVASHGRSAVFDALLGSVARRLVEDSPVDTLIVRDPRAAARTG